MKTTLKITTQTPEAATAIIEILVEMERAAQKHPDWPASPVERAAIVAEEAGEVIREANHIREGIGSASALRMELIQTAGTCIRMINIMDAENKTEIPDFNDAERNKPKGQGLFALFNHSADRRFSTDHFSTNSKVKR